MGKNGGSASPIKVVTCERQRFVNSSVAARTAKHLRVFGIFYQPEKCPECQWFHLRDLALTESQESLSVDGKN
jgi:hypothetical protein